MSKKIIYVIKSLRAGGAERHLFDVANDLRLDGWSVSVVILTSSTPGDATDMAVQFRAAGIDVITLDTKGYGFWYEPVRWFRLLLFVRKLQPDLMHSHLPRPDFAAGLVKKLLTKVVWVSTVHDAYIRGVYSAHWAEPILRIGWRRCDRIIAVSTYVENWIKEDSKLSPMKVLVIPHGIDVSAVNRALKKDEGRVTNRVGTLARFEKRKGLMTLIKAAPSIVSECPKTKLVFAGNDPHGYSNDLIQESRRLSIDHHVEILQFVNDPMGYLHSLDVFVHASEAEGFGIVVLEAMAVGLPVVASDIEPLNQIVEDGVTGFLVPPGDHNGFAAAVSSLLKNVELRSRMGMAGKRRVEIYFDRKGSFERLKALYTEACFKGKF